MTTKQLISANFNFECNTRNYRVIVVNHNVTIYCFGIKDLFNISTIKNEVFIYLNKNFPCSKEFLTKTFKVKYKNNNSLYEVPFRLIGF